MIMRVWPGTPYPLGASWDGEGVNFSIFSENADGVELCLFDNPEDGEASHVIQMPMRTGRNWHAYLPDVRPGNPATGHGRRQVRMTPNPRTKEKHDACAEPPAE